MAIVKCVLYCCCFLIQLMTSLATLQLEVLPETGAYVAITCDQRQFFNTTIQRLIIEKPLFTGTSSNDCFCLLYQESSAEWLADQTVRLWYKDAGSSSVIWRIFDRDDAVNSEPTSMEGIKFRYEYTGGGDPMLIISREDRWNGRSIPQGRAFRFEPLNELNLHLSCDPNGYFDPRHSANPTTSTRSTPTTSGSATTGMTTILTTTPTEQTPTSIPTTSMTPTALTTPTAHPTSSEVTQATPTAAPTTTTETPTTTITTADNIPTTSRQVEQNPKSAAGSSSGGDSSSSTDTSTVVIIVLVLIVAALVAGIVIYVIRRKRKTGNKTSNIYTNAGPVEDNNTPRTSYTGLQLSTPQTGEYMEITETIRNDADDAMTEKDKQYVNARELTTDYENVDVSDVIKNVDVSDITKEEHQDSKSKAMYENMTHEMHSAI